MVLWAGVIPVAAEDESAGEKNYLVMYIVGSDLEFPDKENSEGELERGLATNNLVELMEAWDNSMGDVFIIYGGSNKIGWEGVAYTNLTLLREDYNYDKVIGADDGALTDHVLKRISNHISTPEVLNYSLRYAEWYRQKVRLPNDASRYLIFWNHGSGYKGYGGFTLEGLEAGLKDSKTTYDLIGFDACLMGSLEVADALSPYADYMLASEELAYGYNYTTFSKLSDDPGMTPEDLGRHLIEDYNESRSAQEKTLSLVRLSEVTSVVSALNKFGDELEIEVNSPVDSSYSLKMLGEIYRNTQKFGGNTWLYGYSMDLYEFAENVRNLTDEKSGLHIAAEKLLTDLNKYIVLYDHDNFFSAAYGVSIAVPVKEFISDIPKDVDFDKQGWYTYMDSYVKKAGRSAQPSAVYLNEGDKRLIQVNDSTGTAWVSTNYLSQIENNQYIIIGNVPMQEIWEPEGNGVWTTLPAGTYAEPEWDGMWFAFQSTDGTLVPATLTYKNPAKIKDRPHAVYTVAGNLTRGTIIAPAVLTICIDDESKTVSKSISVTDPLNVRSTLWGYDTVLKDGDVFTPDLKIYDPNSKQVETVISSQNVTFGENPDAALVYCQYYSETDVNNPHWMVKLDDFIDEDVFYLNEPSLEPTATTLEITYPTAGSSYYLSDESFYPAATVYDQTGAEMPSAMVTWYSSNSDVFSFDTDENGYTIITAVYPGNTELSVTCGDAVDRIPLVVLPDPVDPDVPDVIEIDSSGNPVIDGTDIANVTIDGNNVTIKDPVSNVSLNVTYSSMDRTGDDITGTIENVTAAYPEMPIVADGNSTDLTNTTLAIVIDLGNTLRTDLPTFNNSIQEDINDLTEQIDDKDGRKYTVGLMFRADRTEEFNKNVSKVTLTFGNISNVWISQFTGLSIIHYATDGTRNILTDFQLVDNGDGTSTLIVVSEHGFSAYVLAGYTAPAAENGGTDDGAELLASVGAGTAKPAATATATPAATAAPVVTPRPDNSPVATGGQPTSSTVTATTAATTASPTAEVTQPATTAATQAPVPVFGLLAGLFGAVVLLRRT